MNETPIGNATRWPSSPLDSQSEEFIYMKTIASESIDSFVQVENIGNYLYTWEYIGNYVHTSEYIGN